MIDRNHALSLTKQAEALSISRSSVYYLPKPVSAADLALMRRIDELHREFPFAGSRMLRDLLRQEGIEIGRQHVATLMKKMAIEAIYRRGTIQYFVRGAMDGVGRTIDMAVDKDVLDHLLAGRDPGELFARDGLLDELKKALSERMLAAGLDDHPESEGAERRNQPAQWHVEEDDADGHVEGDAGCSTRPGGHVRPEADCQIPAPLPGL